MKIFSISDLHLSINNPKPMDIFGGAWDNYWDNIKTDWQTKVSDDDVVLIGGDISWATKLESSIPDLAEISKLNGKKVIIRGNHDYWWSSYAKVNKILPESMFAIQNNAKLFGNFIICGTRGWTILNHKSNDEDKKIYARELIRLKLTLDEAKKLKETNPTAKVILMMHYPPFNAMWQDSEYTNLISEYDITAVIYGHLHGKDCRTMDIIMKNEVPYYITSCDQVDNKLVLISTDEDIID